MTRHSHCSSCASTDSGSLVSSPGSSSSSGSSKLRKTKTPKKQQQVKKADETQVKRQVKKKLENRISDEEAVKFEQAKSGQELDSSEMNHDTQSDAGTEDIVVVKVDDLEHAVGSVPNDKPVSSEVIPEVGESMGVDGDDAHDVEPSAINVEDLLHEGDGGESSCDENEDVNSKPEHVEAVQELEGIETKLMHHEANPEDDANEVPNDDEGEVVKTVDTEVGPLEKEAMECSDSGIDAIAAVPEDEEAANAAEENGESSSDEKEEDIVFLFNKSAVDDRGVKVVREEEQEHEEQAENISQVNGIEEKNIPPAEKQLSEGNSEQVKREEATETPVEVEDTLDSGVKAEEVVGNDDEIPENEDQRGQESLVHVDEQKPYAVVKSEETPPIDDSEGEKKWIEDFHVASVDQSGQEDKVGGSVPVREDGPARDKIQSLKIDLPSSDSDTDREHNEHAPKASTPSPPKRDREGSSVYKIVKALEGLQVGEKCVHGEIDHGLCHERKVRASSPAAHAYTMKVPRTPEEYRRLASSPADYSGHSRTRDGVGSGTKPHKEPVEHRDVGKLSEFSPFQKKMETPEPNDTVESRDGGRMKEVNSEKTFVQYDSQTGSSTGYTASSTVETYSDTVIFKREDGFVAGKDSRTPALKEIFENGVESGSTHPSKLKIVHEFPAEKGERFGHHHDGDDEEHTLAAAEFAGESEVERILRLQETHDLICPNCRSCITKRVILRKRKRTTVVVNADQWDFPEEVEDNVEDNFLVDNNVEDIAVVEEYEDWGCTACFTWLFRRVRGTRSTQPLEEVPVVPDIGESIVIPSPIVVSEVVQPTEQPGASDVLELPTTPRSQRSDNSCLPILFIWRRKKIIYPESGLATPLLGNQEVEQPEPEATQSSEICEQVVPVDEAQSKELPAEIDDERELSIDKIESTEIQEDSVSVDTTTESSELSAEKTQVSETVVSTDTSESTELAAELTQISEIQEHTGTLPLVTSVRVPVAVIESSEDRLCFPFIWRRREIKTIQLPPSDLQEPLLVKKEEEDEKSENHDYSQIPEELWFHGEEVAVSVAPEDTSAEIPPSVTEGLPDVVSRSERQADCDCLPGLSWRSSERVRDQTGKPERAAQSEISAPPISLESEEVVLPGVSSTLENDRQKASLNCIDILLPAYPWGPKGGATIQDVAQVPQAPGLLEIKVPEVNLEKSSSKVEWSTVTQYLSEGSTKVESREFNIADMSTVDRQPQHEDDSVGEGKQFVRGMPLGMDLEPVDAAQEVEVREASKCLPLVLPSLSWRRRQGKKIGEVLQEKSSAAGPELVGESKEEIISGEEKEGDADVDVSRSVDEGSKPNYQIELEDEVEDEPLVRRAPVKVQPILMNEGKNLPSVSLATQDSSVPEDLTPTYDSFFWDSLPAEPIPGLRPAIKEIEEEGPLQTSKVVVIPADVLEDIIPRYGGMQYKESKEMGSWDCCLPFYTQRYIHIIEERPLEKPVAPEATDIIAEEKGRVVTEQVSKETTVDARVTTTTTTIQSSHDPTHPEERVDAIKVDTSVSYVHSSVQEDQDADVDRNEISDAAAHSVQSEHGEHDDDKSLGLITEILDELGQKDANCTMDQETGSEGVSEAREPAIDVLQPIPAEETQQEARSSRCCLPLTAGFPKWQWGQRAVSAQDSQLREPLLPKDGDVVHVTVQQSHTVTETRETPRLDADPATDVQGLMVVDDDTACSACLPWRRPLLSETDVSTETETTVTVTTDDTVLEVEGRDAEETLLAAREAAEDVGMVIHETSAPEYLKSIVYGGLDVSLTSLGVVASAAGGDAKTRNVIAFGLANLVFGFIAFYHKIQDLHKESPSRFRESVGPSFWVNGFLAIVSFLIFGALPPLMFGFTFRESNDHDYKMGATVVASVIAITLLGCGKVASKMTELSYKRTIFTLILTGVAAAVAGFYTGEYISKLLEKYGIFSD